MNSIRDAILRLHVPTSCIMREKNSMSSKDYKQAEHFWLVIRIPTDLQPTGSLTDTDSVHALSSHRLIYRQYVQAHARAQSNQQAPAIGLSAVGNPRAEL